MTDKRPKRFIKKPIYLYLGIGGGVLGSLIWYFFLYRNFEAVPFICITLVFLGWMGIFYSFFPGVFSKEKQAGMSWGLQMVIKIVVIFSMVGLIGGNINYIIDLEKARENNILTHEPTVTTTAFVTEAEVRQLKNGTRHYAHIRYVANGDTINQERPDDQFQFQAGEYYSVKYSVKFPQMFKLYPK